VAQAVRFARECFAREHAADAGVPFGKGDQQEEYVLAAARGRFLFLQDQGDALEQRILDEFDQAFEHLGLARKVPVQSGLGHPDLGRKARRGDAIPGVVLEHLRQSLKDLLATLDVSRHGDPNLA